MSKEDDNKALPSWLEERLQDEGKTPAGKAAIADSIRKVFVAAWKKGAGKGKLGSIEAIADMAATRLALPAGWLTHAVANDGSSNQGGWLRKQLFPVKPLTDVTETQVDELVDDELDGDALTPTEAETVPGVIEVETQTPQKTDEKSDPQMTPQPKQKTSKKSPTPQAAQSKTGEETPANEKDNKKKPPRQKKEDSDKKKTPPQKKTRKNENPEEEEKSMETPKKSESPEEKSTKKQKAKAKSKQKKNPEDVKTDANTEEPDPKKTKVEKPAEKAKSKGKQGAVAVEAVKTPEKAAAKTNPGKGGRGKKKVEVESESESEESSEEEQKPSPEKKAASKQTKLEDLKSAVWTVRPDVLRNRVSGQDKGAKAAAEKGKDGKEDRKNQSVPLGRNQISVQYYMFYYISIRRDFLMNVSSKETIRHLCHLRTGP